MKRTSTHCLANCIITDGTEKTNNELMKIVATLLSEYFADKYGDNAENIFNCDDRHDMNYLMTEYGVKNAVALAVEAQWGYIIAGYNLPIDKCITMHEDNFWDVFKRFSDLIEERIEYYFDEEKFCWEDIQRIYPSLDIKKYLFGEEGFAIEKLTKRNTGESVEHYKFDTEVEAKNWISGELKTLMDETNDFQMRVDREDNIYTFRDLENCAIITFKFIDYTDRAMVK